MQRMVDLDDRLGHRPAVGEHRHVAEIIADRAGGPDQEEGRGGGGLVALVRRLRRRLGRRRRLRRVRRFAGRRSGSTLRPARRRREHRLKVHAHVRVFPARQEPAGHLAPLGRHADVHGRHAAVGVCPGARRLRKHVAEVRVARPPTVARRQRQREPRVACSVRPDELEFDRRVDALALGLVRLQALVGPADLQARERPDHADGHRRVLEVRLRPRAGRQQDRLAVGRGHLDARLGALGIRRASVRQIVEDRHRGRGVRHRHGLADLPLDFGLLLVNRVAGAVPDGGHHDQMPRPAGLVVVLDPEVAQGEVERQFRHHAAERRVDDAAFACPLVNGHVPFGDLLAAEPCPPQGVGRDRAPHGAAEDQQSPQVHRQARRPPHQPRIHHEPRREQQAQHRPEDHQRGGIEEGPGLVVAPERPDDREDDQQGDGALGRPHQDGPHAPHKTLRPTAPRHRPPIW